MRVLILGSGGREHALCWRTARASKHAEITVLPGNAGTARIARNIPGDCTDVKHVVEVARREAIDLVIVGPEDALAAGVVDALTQAGIRAFGPTQEAAKLESDKAFAKQIMRQHAIPTAEARIFEDYEHAREFIATRDEPLVVKAAGLARGKGAIVCEDPAQALLAAEDMLVKRTLGAAGSKIVVEERLNGVEASLLTITDGRTILVLDPVQDYKRLRDGDAGPNTGGMGAYCPTSAITPETMRQIESQILVPTLDALVREEIPYHGVLYIGLMLTLAGPKVLEFNCRFGDPETQVLMLRMRSDLPSLCDACLRGELDQFSVEWDERAAACVVLASEGYPDKPRTGVEIRGLDQVRESEDLVVFHAGTQARGDQVLTSGGRVLGVSALDRSSELAAARAYEAVQQISFAGMQYRKDIAQQPSRTGRTRA